MKKFVLVLLMAVCSVFAFSERWHCYMSNDTTKAYYDIDEQYTYYTEEVVYDTGYTYWLVEDVQLSKKSMGEDYVHYEKATKYGHVVIYKGSEMYILCWLGYKEDYMLNKYHSFAWIDAGEVK